MERNDPERNCGRCYFALPLNHGREMACHRWPPTQGWPLVAATDQCGEFSPVAALEMLMQGVKAAGQGGRIVGGIG